MGAPLAIPVAVATLAALGTQIGKTFYDWYKGGERHKGARRRIGEQLRELGDPELGTGRFKGIKEYYGELGEALGQQYDIREESLLDKFLGQSYDITQERYGLGRGREKAIAETGMARHGGIEELFRRGQKSTAEQYGRAQKEYGLGREDLALAEEMERVGLGRAEVEDIQALEDLIYRLRTEKSLYA